MYSTKVLQLIVFQFISCTFSCTFSFAVAAVTPFGFTPQYLEGSPLSVFDSGGTLRVIFPAGKFGPKQSGYNFSAKLPPKDVLTLSYEVRVPKDFDFVKGGKLPGLCGGKEATGGKKPVSGEGFSTRVMWRANGRLVSYVYHKDQGGKYGDDFGWQGSNGISQLAPLVWHKIEMTVNLNEHSEKNGSIRIRFNGETVFEKSDFIFRENKSFKIDRICFNTFFGGSDLTWAPKTDQSLEIRNLILR